MKTILPFLLALVCVATLAVFDHGTRADQTHADVVHVMSPALALASMDGTPLPAASDPAADPVHAATEAFDAFKAHKYITGGALILLLLIAGLRKLFPSKLASDRAGAVLALAAGLATAFIGVEALGKLTAATVVDTAVAGIIMAAGAAGIRNLVKRILWPVEL